MNMEMNVPRPLLVLGCCALFSLCPGQDCSCAPQDDQKAALTGDPVSATDDKVMVVFQDSKDNYWFGGGEQGVIKYDGKNLVRFSTYDGLCSNAVLGIQEDDVENIYFDTTGGVCKFDGRTFTTLQVIEAGSDWKLAPKDLWFRMGWDKNGPYRYDGKALYHLKFPRTNDAVTFRARFPNASFEPYGIYSIYKDRKGHMWFGTSSVGACRYDGTSISWFYEQQLTETRNGGSFGIRSILEDRDGHFWFCNTRCRYNILPTSSLINGTSRVDHTREAGINGYTGDEVPYFLSMTEDDNGDLWMVTYDDGVWRSNGKNLTHYPITHDDTHVLLFSIYKDRHGGLWVGSQNAGAFRFNGENFERFIPRKTP